jgi:DNA-directed RNA polymerase sigma subunit (sigma70/sigma32)
MAARDDRGPGSQPPGAQDLKALAEAAGGGGRPDPAEHERLLQAASGGDQEAQRSLLSAHLDWVASAAEDRRDRGLSESDLFQEGAVGLMEAIGGFQPAAEADFEDTCREAIGRHMDRALAEEEAAVRDGQLLVQAAEDFERAEIGLRRELRRHPTVPELAEKLEWTPERTEEIGRLVAEARRRHDEELIQYLDPAEPDGPPGDGGPPTPPEAGRA